MYRSLLAMVLTCATLVGSGVCEGREPTLPDSSPAPIEEEVTQGALRVEQEDGTIVECPLKHTDVKADISGFIARVKVTQTFANPFNERIEAVYVFPLPHQSAVDDMTMVIGQRRIVGLIKRREAARQIYEQALAQGQTAALLEQERPNIFTQSVGNIDPGQEVQIEISYVDVLQYDMGTYEFHFPMVVGPRYNAGAPFPGTSGGPKPAPETIVGSSPTTRPHGVNPSYLKPGFRNGHDISLFVSLYAGVPIWDLKVPSHEAEVNQNSHVTAVVKLSPEDSIPNKDFVMKYTVVGEKPEMAVLCHKQRDEDGYFMLMIQPKLDEELKKAPPREIVFLIDVSGSMRGPKTEKVKEAMREFFALTKPEDKMQVITFAGSAERLFSQPVPVTPENVATALNFTNAIKAGGGTEMLKGIQMVLNEPVDPERVRICIMLTDGYIGNEAEIIAEVGRRAGDKIRFWAIGVDSSPNRFLLDGVAKQGGGMSKVLGPEDDPKEMVGEIVERIHRAQLAGIDIDWGALEVYETYPARIPELWAGRPVILFGRYGEGGPQTIEIRGDVEGQPITYPLEVIFPLIESDNEVLSKVWARRKIEELMTETFYGDAPEVVEEITQIALDYRLMSQFTSFVAVDEEDLDKFDEPVGPPRQVNVPVPLPQGVEFEGIFGPQDWNELAYITSADTLRVGRRKQPSFGWDSADRAYGVPRRAGAVRFFAKPAMAAPGMAGSADLYYVGAPMTFADRPVAVGRTESLGEITRQRGISLNDFAGRPASRVPSAGSYAWWATDEKSKAERGQGIEEAKKAFESAEKLKEKGSLPAARSKYQLAYLLDVASGYAAGVAAPAATALEELKGKWAEEQAQLLPALDKRLDLILRNCSLAEALGAIGKAAGIRLELKPEAEEDARRLLNVSALRVKYLDLRRATVAQALDWVLEPFHLDWQVSGRKEVEVGSARHLEGEWPWVYDVSALAIPTQEELGDQVPQRFQEATREFLEGVRVALSLKENDSRVSWISRGQLLVYSDSKLHARMGATLAFLQNEPGAPRQELAIFSLKRLRDLQQLASKRYAERKELLSTQRVEWEKAEVLGLMNRSSWKLLAGALKGEVALEALTELQIAWTSPRLEELFEEDSQAVVFRSLWALSEAARALPEEREMGRLAKVALGKTAEPAEALPARLRGQSGNPNVFLSVLYSALARRNGTAMGWIDKKEAEAHLSRSYTALITGRKDDALADLRLIASLLLKSPAPATAAALEACLGENLRGDDTVLLAGLAAKRCGGDTWQRFRERTGDILGSQPLEGSVVVLVHRLAGKNLPLVLAQASE